MNHLVRESMFGLEAATVTVTSDKADFEDATPFQIQITFSSAVTGFVVGDITITNATLSNFAGSGTSYTADVTPDLSGDISISVPQNVTVEGNSASNVVSVTSDVAVPESVTWVRGHNGALSYSQADFPDDASDNCEIISNGVYFDPASIPSERIGANAYFGTHLVDDTKKYRVEFTRELITAISADTYEVFADKYSYVTGLIVGVIFNKDDDDAITYGTQNFRGSGTVNDNIQQYIVSLKLGQYDDTKYGRYSFDSTSNYDSAAQYAGASITSAAFEIEKDGTGWVVEFFINGSSVGSHDLYDISSDSITKLVPYAHNNCSTVTKPSIEKITDVTVKEL